MIVQRMALASLVVLCGGGLALSGRAEPRWLAFETTDGATLRYAVVTPEGHDAAQEAPVLLALAPGRQDDGMVRVGMNRWWGEQAAARGWVVVSPVAPNRESFASGGHGRLAELLDVIERDFTPEGGRLHLAGAGAGGVAAFRLALDHARRFHSLVTIQGRPADPADLERLENLEDLRVRFFAGEDDEDHVQIHRALARVLGEAGGDVEARVVPGSGYLMSALSGDGLMDVLDELRRRAPAPAQAAGPLQVSEGALEELVRAGEARAAVVDLLDGLHRAAARADADAYFGSFASDAVILGTALEDRWTLRQYRAREAPRFAAGRGRTFLPLEREVAVTRGGDVAWFDEVLNNDDVGRMRASGVAVRTSDGWRIAQLALSFSVPEELARDVADVVRAAE